MLTSGVMQSEFCGLSLIHANPPAHLLLEMVYQKRGDRDIRWLKDYYLKVIVTIAVEPSFTPSFLMAIQNSGSIRPLSSCCLAGPWNVLSVLAAQLERQHCGASIMPWGLCIPNTPMLSDTHLFIHSYALDTEGRRGLMESECSACLLSPSSPTHPPQGRLTNKSSSQHLLSSNYVPGSALRVVYG